MSGVCSVCLDNSGWFGITVLCVLCGGADGPNGGWDEGLIWLVRQEGDGIREDFMKVSPVGLGSTVWFGVTFVLNELGASGFDD